MDRKTNSFVGGTGTMKTVPLDSTAHQAVVKNATALRRGRNALLTQNVMSSLDMESGILNFHLGRDLVRLDQVLEGLNVQSMERVRTQQITTSAEYH